METNQFPQDIREWQDLLSARETELKTLDDMTKQQATPIPLLFNMYYKFIQNPSTVSVETFKRMVDTDDMVGSGVDFLTTVMAGRVGRYQHKNEKITDWVNNYAMKQIEGGWYASVKEIVSALWAGFSTTEQVWANLEGGFVVKKMVTLPPSTILFETEPTGEVSPLGVLQFQRYWNPQSMGLGTGYVPYNLGWGQAFNTGSFRPDPFAKFGDMPFPIRTANTFMYMTLRIPKAKCILYAFDAQGKFGNPYGRSLLRRAYKYYILKDAFLQMLSTALDRKGTPMTVIWADGAQTIRDPDEAGETGNTAGRRNKGIRADVAARDAFKNIHNDSVFVLPGKKGSIFDVEAIEQTANSDVFIAALNFCNKSICRALLIPSLIFGGEDGGSRALGEEHSETSDQINDGMGQGLKQALLEQYIRPLLAYNFPRSEWEADGVGDFAKREMTHAEQAKVMEIYEKGVNTGVIDQSDLNDLNKMRDSIGFEKRSEPIDVRGDDIDGAEEENPGGDESESGGDTPPRKDKRAGGSGDGGSEGNRKGKETDGD